MVVGVGQLEPLGIELRDVGGEHVAAAAVIGLDGLVRGGEGDDLVFHVVGAEIVGEIELGRGAGLRADRGAVELERRIDLERLAHHEALAVVIIDRREVEPERGVARRGPGRIAGEHVDLARLQRGEAIRRGERNELDLGRIIEDRRRDGAAELDVEAGPVAFVVRIGEAGQALADSAIERAAILHRLERLRGCRRSRTAEHESHAEHENLAFHGTASVTGWPTLDEFQAHFFECQFFECQLLECHTSGSIASSRPARGLPDTSPTRRPVVVAPPSQNDRAPWSRG